MGLFGTKAAKRSGRVLRASGMRMTIGSVETIRALAATRQDWQSDAWRYRDMIGELRFALQFRARAVARVKFFAAQVVPEEDEPLPLNADKGVTVSAALRKAAQEELDRLPLDAGYSFLGLLDENFGVAGEAWLHGYQRDGEERWEVHSVDEVQPGSDGRISIRQFNSASLVPVGDDEEMLRFWVPHPRFKMLADSAMCSLMPVCEEIILAGREMRAASRSRFAANGVLLVPDGLTLLNALKEDTSLVQDSEFMADLTATLLAPIANEGDPGAVVPAVITGSPEDLKEIRHFRMEREDGASLLDKIDRGLARLARGLDIQPEVMTGMASANHWTGWLIDSSTYRYSIDPAVRIVADSFTEGFLRPALVARGFPRAEVAQIQVWYDAGNITENPNRGQDAKDAYDRGAIGFEPLRQALGFSEADAPSDEEVLRMVSMKIGIDTGTSAALLQALFGGDRIPVVAPQPEPRQIESTRPDQEEERAVTGPGETPPSGPEATPRGQSAGAQRLLSFLIADGAPPPDDEWAVDERHGRQLMDIDRAERDRLIQAADAALMRALEKAGAKIRSKAQKDKALAASLVNVDVLRVGATVGRAGVLALGLAEHDLLSDALDALEGKFAKWTEGAIERAIGVVLSMLGLKEDSPRGEKIAKRLRDGMSSRIGAGWALFRAGLLKLAERYLYEPSPEQEPGEAPDGIVPPALVRGSLAIVGGIAADDAGVDDDGYPVSGERPLGGIALGDEVARVLEDEGVEELGFEWAYGITAERHFEPHRELDGQRFASWSDERLKPTERWAWVGPHFQPGDHRGCMCDYIPAYAIPDYARQAADNATETANARNDRMLAELDDAAGRTGTTAQRQRDERQRILAHQKRYIDAGKAAA